MLGGTITLLGTSTNLVVQALLDTDQYKHQTLGMFELAPVGGVLTGATADGVLADGVLADGAVVDSVVADGVVMTVIGSLYMAVVSPKTLGGGAESATEADQEVVAAYGMVFTVEEVCAVLSRMCAGCRAGCWLL